MVDVIAPSPVVNGGCSDALGRRQDPPGFVVDWLFRPRTTESPPARFSAERSADAAGPAVPKTPSGTPVCWPSIEAHLQEISNARSLPSERTAPATTLPCWTLAIRRADAGVVVSVRGQLKGATAATLDHILRDLVCDQGNHRVVVDTGGVSDVDANGVAVLVDAARLARAEHGTLVLIDPSPAMEEGLDRCRGEFVTDDIVARSDGD